MITRDDLVALADTLVEGEARAAASFGGLRDQVSALMLKLEDDEPPVFTNANRLVVRENTTAVVTLATSEPATFAISGGEDSGLFKLTDAELAFKAAPDFEAPNTDNVYRVQVMATDAGGLSTMQDITVTVVNDPADDEPVDGTGTKIRVPNGDALTKVAARTDLKPGTTVALHPDGVFGGTYTFKSVGTKAEPIKIVGEMHDAPDPARRRMTTVSGRFILPKAWVKVSGMRFVGNNRKVEIWGQGTRVNRCLFDGVKYDGMIYLEGESHPEVEIDRNEFRDIWGSAVRGELNNAAMNQNMKIHRNHFNGHSCYGGNESVITILTDAFRDGHVQYHRNLFYRCLRNNTVGQGEIITVKTASAGVTENTVLETQGFISLRETNRSRCVGNYMDGNAFIKVFGDDHVIVNNKGEKIVVELNKGDAYATDPDPSGCRGFGKAGRTTLVYAGRCKPAHTACRRAVVEHNIGRIVIGHKDQDRYGFSRPCVGLKLRYNAAKADRIGTHPDVLETSVGQTVNTAVKLTPVDVGLKA